MFRRSLLPTLLATLAAAPFVHADPPGTSSRDAEPKGTYLGVLFSSIPQPMYAQVPALPADQGVLVNFILPNSPAAKAGLKQYDILLSYNDTAIKDCDHFAKLISEDEPDRAVKLTFVRGGEKQTVEAKLELGPALKVTQAKDPNSDVPKGKGKPAPGGVSLSVEPLEGGLVTVLVEYLDDKSGVLQSIPMKRKTLKQVDDEIDNLPLKILPLAQSAWKKVRGRLEQKNDDKKESSR